MEQLQGFLFLLSILLICKYISVFIFNLMSNPPKLTKMRYYKGIAVDEILIFLSISYFITYIIF